MGEENETPNELKGSQHEDGHSTPSKHSGNEPEVLPEDELERSVRKKKRSKKSKAEVPEDENKAPSDSKGPPVEDGHLSPPKRSGNEPEVLPEGELERRPKKKKKRVK